MRPSSSYVHERPPLSTYRARQFLLQVPLYSTARALSLGHGIPFPSCAWWVSVYLSGTREVSCPAKSLVESKLGTVVGAPGVKGCAVSDSIVASASTWRRWLLHFIVQCWLLQGSVYSVEGKPVPQGHVTGLIFLYPSPLTKSYPATAV